MSHWVAKVVILLASVAIVVIRVPHGKRSRRVPVASHRKGRREVVLLVVASIAFFLPLFWIATPLFDFAEYPLRPLPFGVGIACLIFGLALFYRTHADLGTNWSVSLEVREHHQLVTSGIYRLVRHPMYLAHLIYSVGEALVVPNWFVGPSYAVAMLLLFALRLGPEEQMMRDTFGTDYDAYCAATKRLIPGLW